MFTLPKMNIFWWLFIALQFPFDFIPSDIMTKQKWNGYKGIRAIEAFRYKNTRSAFKCCSQNENEKIICQTVRLSEIQSDAQVVNKKYFCR